MIIHVQLGLNQISRVGENYFFIFQYVPMLKIYHAKVTILNFRLTHKKKHYVKNHPGTFQPGLLSNISLVSESKYSLKKMFSDCSYANKNIAIDCTMSTMCARFA